MIRLKDLITEISLASVTPYANQFVWTDRYGDAESYSCHFVADSHDIVMSMTEYMNYTPEHFKWQSPEWQFAYFVRVRDREQAWTTSAEHSGIKGQLNILRLFKTIGLAIADFAATHENVDVIDITGADTKSAKATQKDRIYANLIESNPELAHFQIAYYGTQLYLVRRNNGTARPDASGIDTPNDPTM